MPAPGARRLPGWAAPQHVFEGVTVGTENAVLLESSDGSGISWIGLGDAVVHDLPAVPLDGGGTDASFDLGWAGWLSYEGEATFLEVDRAIRFDHRTREISALGGTARWADQVAASLTRPSSPPEPEPGPRSELPVLWRADDDAYLAAIAECLRAIVRGDAYVLCLTNTATAQVPVDGWATYRRLAAASPTHSAGYLRIDGVELVSASPERFVEVARDGTVRSRPIKGTRRRDPDAARDAELAGELLDSEKERAENLMIVDLVRNDLSRVARVGSVRVPALFDVESYAQVHQLVSTVEADLLPGLTAADAVRSLFPAGSMTGAPKISAMALLAALEGAPRGVYSGAFGYLSRNGSADLAMAIRSVVVTDGIATIGAGGGVTALSDPWEELAEVRLKAAPLIAALIEGRGEAGNLGDGLSRP
jgi:para-aminobenzoate synthetase component 1